MSCLENGAKIARKRCDGQAILRDGARLLPLVLALFIASCGGSGDTESRSGDPLIPAVEAVQARRGSLPLTERLTGVVRAQNQVGIYPEISAVVTQVLVQNGDDVERGQPLVQLRDTEFRERLRQARANRQIAAAQVKQMEAQLEEVLTELRRIESLAEQALVSPQELEQIRTRTVLAEADLELAQARLEQAEATVDERQEALSQTVIRAPVSGMVGGRNAEVGMLVSSSSRLFTVGQLDSVRIEVVLTDRMLTYIEEGQRTEIVASDDLSGIFTAPLSRISPFLHPVAHSTEAEIDLANPDHRLKSGMFVTVDVFYGESEEATLVPLSALYENPGTGETGVYVSRGDLDREQVGTTGSGEPIPLTEPVEFEFVPVEILAKGRMNAGIRGVSQGSWVVTLGQDLLGARSGTARVRKVEQEWVERLQRLQRHDLLQDVMLRQQAATKDTP